MSKDRADLPTLLVRTSPSAEDQDGQQGDKKSEFLDWETKAVLHSIWRAQHPINCSSAHFLILTSHWKQGPGSALHMRCRDLMLGLDLGRVVVDAPDLSWDHASQKREYCSSAGFDCYFQPLSHCAVPHDYRRLGVKASSRHFESETDQTDRSMSSPGQDVQWLYIDNSRFSFSVATGVAIGVAIGVVTCCIRFKKHASVSLSTASVPSFTWQI